MIECKYLKLIQIIAIACSSDQNIKVKVREKLPKYQQMTYKNKKRRLGCHVKIIPEFIRCRRGGSNRLRKQTTKILETHVKKMPRTWKEILKTLLAESESIIRKVVLNIIIARLGLRKVISKDYFWSWVWKSGPLTESPTENVWDQ